MRKKKTGAAPVRRTASSSKKNIIRQNLRGYAFILPSLLGVMIFVLVPFCDAVKRSFMTAMSGEFVGLDNFTSVFSNKAFQLAAQNTAKFIGVCVPLLLLLSLAFSCLLNGIKRFSELLKTAYLVPLAIPVASVVMLWRVIFHENGMLNSLVEKLGGLPVDWMDSDYAFWVLVFSYLWKNMGYNMVLWLAGLQGIPFAYYEAASLDGCGGFRKFIYITLPNLKATVFTVIVMSIINSFKVFREAYLVAGDYPHESIYLLQHLFNNWFVSLDIQKMCAAAVVLAGVITFAIVILKRLDRE